jgi:phosphatidylglycerol---prolipoprotein diacylglyceryl transferase
VLPMTLPLAYFVHEPHPFLGPHWGNFGIRIYGLGYLLGFAAAYFLLVRYARHGRSQLPETRIVDLMTALVLGVMIGGRLGWFLLYHPRDLFNPPWAFFQVWNGGMASHGGFLGVAIALAWFARQTKIPFAHLGDLIVSAAPVGLGLVRIANFLNGELWGKVTSVSWGVIFDQSGGGRIPRHPSQLYESALEGLLLFGLMQLLFWKTEVVRTRPGLLSGVFLIAYAIVRMICEVFREPDASLFLGLSRGTFYSIFLIVGGLALILRSKKSNV